MLTARVYSLALEFDHGPGCLPMGSVQTTTEAFEMGTHQPHDAELAERPGTSITSFAPFRALVSCSHLCTLFGKRAPMYNVTAFLPTAQFSDGRHNEHVLQDLR